jgi:hypothetical protein
VKNEVIRIYPNVPVDMVLAYAEGKPCSHGKIMFSTVDDRCLFVPEAAGREIQARLNDMRIRRGDRILITQFVEYGPGGKETSWKVVRAAVSCGQQPDGSFVVPSQPGAASPPGKAAPGPTATPQPERMISVDERFDRLEELIIGLHNRLEKLLSKYDEN